MKIRFPKRWERFEGKALGTDGRHRRGTLDGRQDSPRYA